jgi:hypothetical protein
MSVNESSGQLYTNRRACCPEFFPGEEESERICNQMFEVWEYPVVELIECECGICVASVESTVLETVESIQSMFDVDRQ